jgi:hypothetical protein
VSSPAWLSFVEKLAPTIAQAIPIPGVGLAVSFIEQAMGWTGDNKPADPVAALQKAVESNSLTTDQIIALKNQDVEFQKFLKQKEIDLEQLQLQDVEGARQMQTARPSPVPAILSIIITLGFLGLLSAMLAGVDVTDNQAFLILIGALGSGFTQVLNFWLGSTRHSQNTASLNAETIATVARK